MKTPTFQLRPERTREEQRRARRVALARARRCYTCRQHADSALLRRKPEPCFGCEEVIDYYSCSPGYCRACAHDPSWVPLKDLIAEGGAS